MWVNWGRGAARGAYTIVITNIGGRKYSVSPLYDEWGLQDGNSTNTV